MMGRYYSPLIKVMIFIIDFWLIDLAFAITRELDMARGIPYVQLHSFFLVFSLVWIVTGLLYKIYRVDALSLMRTLSINLLSAFITHVVVIATVVASFPDYTIGLEFLIYVYVLSAAFIIASRVIYKVIRKYFEFSGFDRRNVIIIGVTGSGRALYEFFENDEEEGYQFKGFFDDQAPEWPGFKQLVVGRLDDVKNYCVRAHIDEIYFALPLTNKALIQDISRFADDHFIHFRIAPDFSNVVHDKFNVFLINSIPVVTTRREPLEVTTNAHLKRAFDIFFSLAVILLIFPIVVPLIALAIRMDSEGPIFFKQLRPGKKNKLFECYKFRTMCVNNRTEVQATKNDSRVTRVGRFLRKTNLDELPQFFNVLLGSMSVVGPRPNMISQLEEYSKSIEGYKVRHFITPGITGYAQVNGYRGETKELELMAKRVQYDVLYLENWSLELDLKIIWLTIWNMLKGDKNAY